MKKNVLLPLTFAVLIIALAVWFFLSGDSRDLDPLSTDDSAVVDDSDQSPPEEAKTELAKTADSAKTDEAKVEEEEDTDPIEFPPLLRGKVVGEGVGIPGAEVKFYAMDDAERLLLGLEKIIPQGGGFPDIPVLIGELKAELQKFRTMGTEVTTDANGEFELREGKPGGNFILVLAQGWIFKYGDVVSLTPGETEEITIELQRGTVISGSVVTQSGAPIPGATVIAEYRPPGMQGVGKLVRRGLALVNGEFLKGPFETQTDSDGNYVLDSLPPGVYDIAASSPGKVENRLELVHSGTDNAVVVIGDGALIHGYFVDKNEQPVSGVEAKLERLEDRIQLPLPAAGFNDIANTVNRYLGEPPRMAVSSADGSFFFPALGSGKYQLTIQQRGFLRYVKQIQVGWSERKSLGALTIDRGQTVTGIVRDEGGEPLGNIAIIAAPMKMGFLNGGVIANDFATGRLHVTTREDGTFSLSGLKRSKYRVGALAAGYGGEWKEDVTGESEPLEYVMKRGLVIRGRVIKKGTEEGLSDIRVECAETRAKTDKDGYFVLDGVSPTGRGGFEFGGRVDRAERREAGGENGGAREREEDDDDDDENRRRRRRPRSDGETFYVKAEAKGYIRGYGKVERENLEEEVVIEIEKAPTVRGVVLDPEGEPAPGTLVRLTPAFPPEFDDLGFFDTAMIFLGVTVSDRQGRFSFDNFHIGPGGDLRVVADHVLYARGVSDSFDFDAEFKSDNDVEVTLVQGSTVRGVVTDGSTPISGATLRLRKFRGEEKSREAMFMKMLGLPKGGETVHSNADGEYVFSKVIPGDYVVSAEVEGFTESSEETITVAASADSTVNFEMNPGGTIVGTVSDGEGNPLAGVKVRALRESGLSEEMRQAQRYLGGSYKSTKSVEDGGFEIHSLPGGSYTLIAERKGFRDTELSEVVPDEKPIRLTLVRSGTFVGLVGDSVSGDPLPQFQVEFESQDEESSSRRFPWGRRKEYSNPKGRFERDDLTPGEYKVTVSAEGFVPATVDVTLGEGDFVERSFVLLRAGVIEGVITDAQSGEPIYRARIRLVAVVAPVESEAGDGGEKKGGIGKGIPRVGDGLTKRVGPKKTEAELAAEDIEAVREHFVTRFRNPIRSERDGSFSIDSVTVGNQMLIVTHDDYMEARLKNVSVAMGEAFNGSVALHRGMHVAGRVVDASGVGLDDKNVFIRGTGEQNRGIRKSVESASDGSFRINGLPSGPYRVFLFRRGQPSSTGVLTVDLTSSQDSLEFIGTP